MYIDITNDIEHNATYHIIIASNDYPMFNLVDNSIVSGVIPGYSKDELVTYGAFVCFISSPNSRLQGALIPEVPSTPSTSQSTATLFLPRPFAPTYLNTLLRRKSVPYSLHPSNSSLSSLTRDGNKLFASISRSHYLYCMACTRYVDSASLCDLDSHSTGNSGRGNGSLLSRLPRGSRHKRAADERGVPQLGHAGHPREPNGDRLPNLRVRLRLEHYREKARPGIHPALSRVLAHRALSFLILFLVVVR